MPTYGEIRDALSRGFYVENLRAITNLSLKTLQQDEPKNPAVFHALASVSHWVADAWDDVPIIMQVANRVEGQLKPELEALLNAADGIPEEVCAALNAVANAFREAVKNGLDSDLG